MAQRKTVRIIHHPLYSTWLRMRERCNKADNPKFARWGGRGIKVCARWQSSFANFVADMGPKPSPKHSIDRIDNNGNYEPGNCRWATTKEQARNVCYNTHLRINGRSQTIAAWAEEVGLPPPTIQTRMRLGWTGAALIKPARSKAPDGNPHRPRKIKMTPALEAQIVRQYRDGLPMKAIAERLPWDTASQGTVGRVLARHGVKSTNVRGRARAVLSELQLKKMP